MTSDERSYFQALGTRIADARRRADLTQVQLADRLGISQPQLAFYEVGHRRVSVSMLPGLARVLAVAVETLIEGEAAPSAIKARQKVVSQVLDAMLAQHSG